MDRLKQMQERSPALVEAISIVERIQRPFFVDQEDTSKFSKQFAETMAKQLGYPDSFAEEVLQKQIEAKAKLFSRYENPMWFELVHGMVAEIHAAESIVFNREKFRSQKEILFGTLETGRINGMAIDTKNPEYDIVLIETGIFGYANLLAKGLAHMFPPVTGDDGQTGYSTEPKRIEENLRENPVLVERVMDLFFSYLLSGNPHAAKPYLPDREHDALVNVWRAGIEIFVLSHEFGHSRLGHLLPERPTPKPGFEEYGEISINWQQETEADLFALTTTLACLRKRGINISLSYASIEAFFFGLEIIERVIGVFRNQSLTFEGTSTHPPVQLRRDSIRSYLQKMVPADEARSAIELATIVCNLVDRIWPAIEKHSQLLKTKGVRLHAKWQNY